jgi:two-component system LytT family response regulator
VNAIRALIVDDEPLARDCIRLALAELPDVELAGECKDGESAVRQIRKLSPDLVFLDVQMPGMDGFDVIETVGSERMPPVIFVTAFDRHAIRAFDVHALDYLLKPFDDARLHDAVRHARARIDDERIGSLAERLTALLENRHSPETKVLRRLAVRERERIRYIDVSDVDYLTAEGNYVRLHVGRETHLIRLTLSALERDLDDERFQRIHRSTIVNLDRVAELQPWGGGDYVAILKDKQKLRVSRTYRDGLLNLGQ